LTEFLKKQGVENVELIESSGGAFEVTKNGLLIFSKLKEHRFPEDAEILDLIANK
jgi:selT/selW/selH-like putative selenoprotein